MKRIAVFILLILCISTVMCNETIQTKTNSHFSVTFDVKREFSWYNELPLLPIVFSSSEALLEGQCKNQAKLYRHKLETFTLWAVQMFDASTKYPDGILAGNMKHLGNFDSCYNLHATVSNEGRLEDIHGRYCLIELSYGRLKNSSLTSDQLHLEFDSNLSAWESVEYHGDFRRVHRDKLLLAICVPASCNAADVEVSLKKPLEEFAASHGLYIYTSVQSKYCTTRHEQSFSYGDFIYWGIILMIGALILGGSWYDNRFHLNNNILSKDISYIGKFFLCFSVRRNYNSIFHQSTVHDELECIHSIRVLFMVLVILGHRTMQYFGYPIVTSLFLEYLYTTPLSMFIFNCIVIVDGFLAIGGLLLSYHLFDNLTKTGRINFTALILIRFLRLTPVYMLIVFFNATTLPKLGSGPFWEARIGLERDNCLNNWWTHLLYINNYVNPKNLCMFLTWYLAVDFHLYTMGLFVIYAVWRWPRLKFLIVTGTTIIGFTGPFIITYKYDSQPTFLGLPWLQDARHDEYFTNRYIKTHMRIGVYMIGIIAGLIIQRYKNIAWKIPTMLSRVLFIIMILLCVTSVLLLYSFYDPNVKTSPFKIALYSVLHRFAFVFGITGIVVLLTVGNGLEYCRKILSPRWIVPWARLTYGAYLVHNVLQIYSLGTTRAPRYVSFHNTFSDVTFDVVFTFLLSLLLSIMIEGPFRQLEKVFLIREKQGNVTSHINFINKAKKYE